MFKHVATLCAAAFLFGTITAKNVFAEEPEWMSKPIQCASLEKITAMLTSKGLQVLVGGKGVTHSPNTENPLEVTVFLNINPSTKEGALVEVSPDMSGGCLLGFGPNITVDAENLSKLTGPTF